MQKRQRLVGTHLYCLLSGMLPFSLLSVLGALGGLRPDKRMWKPHYETECGNSAFGIAFLKSKNNKCADGEYRGLSSIIVNVTS